MCQAKLMNPMEALHLRPLQQFQDKALDLHAAMHAIMDYLGTRHEL
jgi:hypothetical protein